MTRAEFVPVHEGAWGVGSSHDRFIDTMLDPSLLDELGRRSLSLDFDVYAIANSQANSQ